MYYLKLLIKYLFDRIIFNLLKYLFPIKKQILFESLSDFSDNSKIVFFEIIEKDINKEYKIFWFVENPEKFNDYTFDNVKFIKINEKGWKNILIEIRNFYLISTSKYYFYTHRNFTRTKPKYNQKIINLTHGTSLKNTKGIHPKHRYNSVTTVTSKFTQNLRVQSYNGGNKQMVITGLPRNDYLFQKLDLEQLDYLNIQKFDKIIFWLPTFRRQKGRDRNDTGTTSSSDIPIINDDKQWNVLNSYLNKKKTLLIIKPHPVQRMEYIKNINFSNIRLITNEELNNNKIHLYSILGASDALISDYSSIYIDYLLLNKPIAFTVDDFEGYKTNLGFSVSNPFDYMPGHKIYDIEDLMTFIQEIYETKDKYFDQRQEIRNLFHHYQDGNSTDRVLNLTNL